jgi:hypothetical protein
MRSLCKCPVFVVVKRPGSIAACRELGEKSIPEDAPLPLSHFAFGYDSPIKMLNHIQGVKINVRVKPLRANGAVYAQRPKVRFEDEGPAVGISAGNNFEANASSNNGFTQRLDRDGVSE